MQDILRASRALTFAELPAASAACFRQCCVLLPPPLLLLLCIAVQSTALQSTLLHYTDGGDASKRFSADLILARRNCASGGLMCLPSHPCWARLAPALAPSIASLLSSSLASFFAAHSGEGDSGERGALLPAGDGGPGADGPTDPRGRTHGPTDPRTLSPSLKFARTPHHHRRCVSPPPSINTAHYLYRSVCVSFLCFGPPLQPLLQYYFGLDALVLPPRRGRCHSPLHSMHSMHVTS